MKVAKFRKRMGTQPLSASIAGCMLLACVAGEAETLSDPAGWNGDFMRGAKPTDNCEVDTLSNLRTRMGVSSPFTVEEYEKPITLGFANEENPSEPATMTRVVSDFVKERITDADRIHEFFFRTDPGAPGYWGFTGVLVARGECIIHVEITGYDN